MIKVYTNTYNEIFRTYKNICVPEYQRPYRWSTDKVEDLLSDFKEFFIDNPSDSLEYYLGSILFYHNRRENKYEIIDGQQRLTTLILLQQFLDKSLLPEQNLSYNNHISFYHVKENLKYLENRITLLNQLKKISFFERLRFTVIISHNKDNAFAFFDSQNNRGVSLGADDYLKAYHLREVSSETLQEGFAKQWEQSAIKSQMPGQYETGLLHLFYKILYRARQWKGQSQIIPEDKDPVLKTFQKNTIKNVKGDLYELFPGRNNLKYKFLRIDDHNFSDFFTEEDEDRNRIDMPFSIRQPIFKGHNFFLYAQKYHAIFNHLFFDEDNVESSVLKMRKYYNHIYTENMSLYLRHYMQLCLVLYYDSFGDGLIYKAIRFFDYFIGSIRVEKYYVKKEAVKNSLIKNSSNNLLDVIASAYMPQEIFDFISEQQSVKKIYENENLGKDNGVRWNYKKRVLSYFVYRENSLKNRLQWIR